MLDHFLPRILALEVSLKSRWYFILRPLFLQILMGNTKEAPPIQQSFIFAESIQETDPRSGASLVFLLPP